MIFNKGHVITFLVANVASISAIATPMYIPSRISYSALTSDPLDSNGSFLGPLVKDGLISITDVPGLKELKKDTLTWLHACLLEQDGSTSISEHIYDDGTVRRTIASVTIPGPGEGRPQSFFTSKADKSLELPPACQEFSKNLDAFRHKVHQVTTAFAERLTSEIGSSLEVPLLSTEDGHYSFDRIEDLVKEGDHLEHFHSSQKPLSSIESNEKEINTIEMHTDQGFFIAFTPAMIIAQDGIDPAQSMHGISSSSKMCDGFYIETSHGVRSLVKFEPQDDLVFMIGDGANQYVNNKLDDAGRQSNILRATPHAVSIPAIDSSYARVWYGRMVLPPANSYSKTDSMTHGQIRSRIVQANAMKEAVPGGLGCSISRRISRQLDTPQCQEDETHCWSRCMAHAQYELSDDTCAEQNLDLKCINPREQVYVKGHGDYYLACTNSTEEITPYPTLPTFPRSDDQCTDFTSFSDVADYDHIFDMTTNKTTAKFMWSVQNGGRIKGRLAFDGIFGFIALGFAFPGGRHNGMNGAKIFMGVPGGDYTAKTGLDLEKFTPVQEYQISHGGSSYRHWKDPLREIPDDISADIESTECFTALTFESDCIHDRKFNYSGTDVMLWAANAIDSFAGYHSANRAVFTVEWSTGKVNFGSVLNITDTENDDGDDNDDDHNHDDNDKIDLVDGDDSRGESCQWKVASTTVLILFFVLGLIIGI